MCYVSKRPDAVESQRPAREFMSFDPLTDLDDTDWRILRELQENGRIAYAELGRLVNLSRPAVAERMHRLEDLGVIVGYRAEVSLARLGYDITAFVRVAANRTDAQALVDMILDLPEALECHRGGGDDAFLIKVAVSSLAQLQTLLDKFARFGVATSTITLSNVMTKRIVTDGFEPRGGFDEGGGI
jgi:Lrp/AsnC family leucine-responsive transcriptional regulator